MICWQNDEGRNHALGAGYRISNGGRLSAVLGAAYITDISENLLRHADAYVELRVTLSDHVACQVSHYSSIGKDRGENLLLCGLLWNAAAGR